MTDTNLTPAPDAVPTVVTYGGVQDRPGDVNHPDNLATATTSTDPAATGTAKHAAPGVPDDFQYDPATDTYTRVAPVTEHYNQ